MKAGRKFLQQMVYIYKGEDPIEYMIIVEYDAITSLPIRTYIVEVPQQYLAFSNTTSFQLTEYETRCFILQVSLSNGSQTTEKQRIRLVDMQTRITSRMIYMRKRKAQGKHVRSNRHFWQSWRTKNMMQLWFISWIGGHVPALNSYWTQRN
jgi:hypothetical protein